MIPFWHLRTSPGIHGTKIMERRIQAARDGDAFIIAWGTVARGSDGNVKADGECHTKPMEPGQ